MKLGNNTIMCMQNVFIYSECRQQRVISVQNRRPNTFFCFFESNQGRRYHNLDTARSQKSNLSRIFSLIQFTQNLQLFFSSFLKRSNLSNTVESDVGYSNFSHD